jgi:hypothetical protein
VSRVAGMNVWRRTVDLEQRKPKPNEGLVFSNIRVFAEDCCIFHPYGIGRTGLTGCERRISLEMCLLLTLEYFSGGIPVLRKPLAGAR